MQGNAEGGARLRAPATRSGPLSRLSIGISTYDALAPGGRVRLCSLRGLREAG